MRRARLSRGHDPRFLWQVGATARGVGALFVRSYERGERVHLAMLSRGFDGAHALRRGRRPEPAAVARGPGPGGVRGGAGGGRLERGVTVPLRRPAPAPPAPRPQSRRRRWTSPGSPSPTPTGTRPCTGSTCGSSPASGSRCSARTGPARRRWCCTSTASCGPAPARVAVGGLPVAPANLQEIRRRVGIVFQDPDDQLFMPTVGEDVAFGPANFGVTGAALRERVDAALAAVGMLELPRPLPAAPVRWPAPAGGAGHRAGLRAGDPRARRAVDEPGPGGPPRAGGGAAGPRDRGGTSMLMVTHDLPYALQLCPRSVILDDGVVVADGPTRELLADPALLARHRLELPFGFTPEPAERAVRCAAAGTGSPGAAGRRRGVRVAGARVLRCPLPDSAGLRGMPRGGVGWALSGSPAASGPVGAAAGRGRGGSAAGPRRAGAAGAAARATPGPADRARPIGGTAWRAWASASATTLAISGSVGGVEPVLDRLVVVLRPCRRRRRPPARARTGTPRPRRARPASG